ncbi:hypothetical protein P5673_022072 [Acropora cervicornis]|uniref:Uncharacterized protein n=1 Tax=Acropora cervicornis TaxID=6130 RepID=A0AAD9Q7C6_ACRCE|nr:hypothetical protein P5673_022072 [Acropora cervicornis]
MIFISKFEEKSPRIHIEMLNRYTMLDSFVTKTRSNDKMGILELDKFKESEMKDIFRTEYLSRFKLVMKGQSSKPLGCVAHVVWNGNNKME